MSPDESPFPRTRRALAADGFRPGLLAAVAALLLLGLWAVLPAWLHGLGLLAFLAALGGTAWRSRQAWRWPSHNAGLRRLERVNQLPHQPLRSLGDRLSGGSSDPATQVLWRRHVERLRQAVRGLRVGSPRSDLPGRDPWALRVAIALLLVVAATVAFYVFPEQSAAVRVLGILIAVAAAAVIMLQTEKGREIWAFLQGAQIEVRKVVWPTREETVQTTLIVIVMVIIIALILWGLDAFLGWAVGSILGTRG